MSVKFIISTGFNLPISTSWSGLSALEPAEIGQKCLVPSPNGSTRSGYMLAERFSDRWDVVGCDTTTRAYLDSHPIPNNAPTIPQAREWVGKDLSLQNEPKTIGGLTGALAGGAVSECTLTGGFKNTRGKKIKSVRILSASVSTSNAATISMRVARKGAGSVNSPEGSWSQVTWSNSNTYTPPPGAYSGVYPKFFISDSIQISGGVSDGDSIVLWVGLSGGTSTQLTLPSAGGSLYKPSLFESGNFCTGDYASVGASGTPSWTNIDISIPALQMLFEYDTATDPQPIVNIVAIGDSTFAEVVPVAATNGDGWSTTCSNLAKSAGKSWRIQSWGQAYETMSEHSQRIQALVDGGIMPFVDVILRQGWTWNDRFMGSIGQVDSNKTRISNDKSIVNDAGCGYVLGIISPPGQRQAYETIPTDLDSVDLDAYDTLSSYMENVAPGANFNIQSYLWDPDDHRRFLAANSSDNVQCFIGTGIGQNLQGAAAYDAINPILTTLGY